MSQAAPSLSPRGYAVRLVAVAGAASLAVVGATGFTQQALFTQASGLKYALTVAAPLLLLLAASTHEPLRVFTPAVIIAAPFAGFTATFGDVAVPLLAPLVIAASVAAVLTEKPRASSSSLATSAVLIVALLALPIATGDAIGRYVLLLVTIILLAWLTSRTAVLPGGLELVLGAFLASTTLQAALALWEESSGHRLDLYDATGERTFGSDYFFSFGDAIRPSGAFYDPISLGNVLAVACPLALALAVSARSAWLRLGAASAGIVCAIALAFSLSRMSWIGAVAGLVLTVALMPRGSRVAASVGLLTLATLTTSVVLATAGGSLGDRFDSILSPRNREFTTSAGDRERVELWRAAIDVAAEHPVAGVGLGRLQPELSARFPSRASHAHSTYLQILGEAGILGALGLLVFLIAVCRDLGAGLRRNRAVVAGLAGACVALLVGWVTDYSIRYAPVAAMVGVLIGLVSSQGLGQDSK